MVTAGPQLGRRAFLISVAAIAAAGSSFAAERPTPRLAAIDWAMLETAIALGQMPVAACELIRYRADTETPVIPDSVTDLGLRGAPNYELLQLTRPDFILSSPFYAQHEARLRSIAPVISLPFYVPGEPPVDKALAALTALAIATGQPDSALAARTRYGVQIRGLSKRITPFTDRPVCLVNIGDARHLRAFGYDSLFGDMLGLLGMQNAWTDRTQFSFRAPLPVERLAEMPDAHLVIVGTVPVEARSGLARSVLWRHLPAVAEGRVLHLPDVNAFGGMPSALRFASLLTEAFEAGPRAA
ncbi:iron-siderophore ABC transporter substrate-binding protein [Paracoccus litorisediminis]|uniref:iron-siderophore ABC transporter substrate-binding protein n=1 Tax=Paracoccus litorisediminis TaxID=2006130 RepID=UPI0031B59D10